MAATFAALSFMPLTDASAATIKFTYGPWVNHSMTHNGRKAVQVCRTKYKWVIVHGKPAKVPDGKDCHWTYPPMKPIKPLHPKLPMHPKKY